MVAFMRASYSASILDRVTMGCFFEIQKTKVEPK